MKGNWAAIAFTRGGCTLGDRIVREVGGTLWVPERFVSEFQAQSYGDLSHWTAVQFAACDGLIFVSAAGIAVRAIAPWVKDKFTDPAVVSVDERGQFVIPLLSGHVGGGNALAQKIADAIGAVPVISTATDINGLFAVDVWARQNRLYIAERDRAKEVSAALLEGTPVGFSCQVPWTGILPKGVTMSPCELGISVGMDGSVQPFPKTLHLIPQNLILGIGCKRGTSSEHLAEVVEALLQEHGIDLFRVAEVATIDLKRDEAGLVTYCRQRGWPISFYSAEQLWAVPGTFPPSNFVTSVTGVDNVCQRAAACAGGAIRLPKQAKDGVTLSVAQRPFVVTFEEKR